MEKGNRGDGMGGTYLRLLQWAARRANVCVEGQVIGSASCWTLTTCWRVARSLRNLFRPCFRF
eukprot:7851900-Pyramimonas_sp.AAC.1